MKTAAIFGAHRFITAPIAKGTSVSTRPMNISKYGTLMVEFESNPLEYKNKFKGMKPKANTVEMLVIVIERVRLPVRYEEKLVIF